MAGCPHPAEAQGLGTGRHPEDNPNSFPQALRGKGPAQGQPASGDRGIPASASASRLPFPSAVLLGFPCPGTSTTGLTPNGEPTRS